MINAVMSLVFLIMEKDLALSRFSCHPSSGKPLVLCHIYSLLQWRRTAVGGDEGRRWQVDLKHRKAQAIVCNALNWTVSEWSARPCVPLSRTLWDEERCALLLTVHEIAALGDIDQMFQSLTESLLCDWVTVSFAALITHTWRKGNLIETVRVHLVSDLWLDLCPVFLMLVLMSRCLLPWGFRCLWSVLETVKQKDVSVLFLSFSFPLWLLVICFLGGCRISGQRPFRDIFTSKGHLLL